MANKIVESGGLIVSEYPGRTVCQRWMFPQRNRIVVGLSEMVIIIEAGEKSGTLSTAKWAQKMGKMVYAVPGSMFSETSEGSNYLVGVGLAKVLSRNVLDKLTGSEREEVKKKVIERLGGQELALTTYLRVSGPLGVNELARGLGVAASEILARLMRLEMKDLVAEERGVWKM